jgi:hypothetical protein
MGGLAIGLAVGFAVAGGAISASLSVAGDFVGGLVGAVTRDQRLMNQKSHPLRDGLIGAFVGAAAGGLLGIGIEKGMDMLGNDAPDAPTGPKAVLQQNCRDSAAPGDSIVFEQNELGQPVCRVVKAPAPQH